MTTIIIIAVIAILVLWVIGVQRKLVNCDEKCKNAMSQIGVQQSSRWDALTALTELIKSYNEHEYNTICGVIAQRAKISGNSSTAQAQDQENKITEALSHIVAVAEQYPELKANENYGKAMDSVNTYENQVRVSRMVFNDCVTMLNKMVRQFPSSILAGPLGFKEKDYLEVEQTKTSMPSMKI